MKTSRQLAFVLCLCIALVHVALPAQAQQVSHYSYVTTREQMDAALDEIAAQASAAQSSGVPMQQYTIELGADIPVTEDSRLLFSTGANVRIDGGEGVNHRIYLGDTDEGVIYIRLMKSTLVLENVTLDGCNKPNALLALLAGGDITFGKGTVIENYAVGGSQLMWSIALAGAQPMVRFDQAIMRNNSNTGSYSSLLVQTGGELHVNNSEFYNNHAVGRGGVFHISGGTAQFSNSHFEGNGADGGGAIFATISDVTITDCTFHRNTAFDTLGQIGGDAGGAVHVLGEVVLNVKGCTFTQNESDIGGGAVEVWYDSEATFEDCVFSGNVAATHGGAIDVTDAFSAESDMASSITVTNTLFENNRANGVDLSGQNKSDPLAPGGGAIYLHEYCEATLGKGTQLRGNATADRGGAVYVCFGARLTMDGAVMENNTAAVDGGAVYVDGTGAYTGYSHAEQYIPTPDDGYATGGKLYLKDGRIAQNKAGRNGGGVFIGGENMVEVNGETLEYTGGEVQMTGGVITENHADDMGGGVYVASAPEGETGGILKMTDGGIYLNIAGENGNTSSGADDAGADVYSEGGNAFISVVSAKAITAYAQDVANRFVPARHRSVYFTNWYDDYSDQDPEYGKADGKTGTGVNTGRYESSIEPDRMVYIPLPRDGAYNALILDCETKPQPKTGDDTPLALYGALAAAALGVATAAGSVCARRKKS